MKVAVSPFWNSRSAICAVVPSCARTINRAHATVVANPVVLVIARIPTHVLAVGPLDGHSDVGIPPTSPATIMGKAPMLLVTGSIMRASLPCIPQDIVRARKPDFARLGVAIRDK